MKKMIWFLGVILFSFVVAETASAASNVLLYTNVSKKYVKVNEMTSILAMSNVAENNLPPDTIKIFINDNKQPSASCENAYHCDYWFLEQNQKNANKWVKFKTISSYKKSSTTKINWIFVQKSVIKPTSPQLPDISNLDAKPANALAYDKIVTSNHQLKVGESFVAELYPSYPKLLSKVQVNFDDKLLKSCDIDALSSTCSFGVGPFTAGDVGEHKYEFVMFDKNGKSNKVFGKFWVNAITDVVGGAPEYDKMTVSSYTLTAGEKFKATVYAKPGQTFFSVKGYVSGNDLPQMVCLGSSDCSMVIETTAAYMIGEHTFKFVLEAQNGKTTTLSGKFLVVKATEKDMIAPSVSVSSDKDTLKLGESATITAYAKDNKAVSKIEILMFDGVVKECANTGVCVYQIGPITEKTYIKQYTYSAIAYDAAGNNIYSGNKYIAVDAIQPVTVEPNILIEASKANINTTETVTFKSTVNPGSKKLAKLQILVNAKVVKECVTNTCEYTGGPFPAQVGSAVSYAATAYFSDGTWKTTGYYYLSVTNAPTLSIKTSPQNPADTSAIMFTANATAGNKTISYLELLVNNKSVKTCFQAAVCSFMGGPYPEYVGKTVIFAANMIFTDGSIMSTDYINLSIITTKQVEPIVTLKSDKTSVVDKETFTLSSTLDQGTKKAESWTLYSGDATIGGGAVSQYCNTGTNTCSIGLYVLNQTNSFYAEAKFTDGTIYKSSNVIVTLHSTVNPNTR